MKRCKDGCGCWSYGRARASPEPAAESLLAHPERHPAFSVDNRPTSECGHGEMTKMKTILTVLALLALCTACASTEERIAAAKKKCEAYGFVEGTNELAQCVMYVNEWRYAQPYPVFTTGIIGGVGHW